VECRKFCGRQQFDAGSLFNSEPRSSWNLFLSIFITLSNVNNLKRYSRLVVRLAVHNWLFQFGWAAWSVPDRYDCSYGEENDNMACSQNANIPCWVSRPMEKEVMMWYMLSMSLVSVALGIVFQLSIFYTYFIHIFIHILSIFLYIFYPFID